jgi:hypothetical protein
MFPSFFSGLSGKERNVVHGTDKPPLIIGRKHSEESRSSIERRKSLPSANDNVQRDPVPHLHVPGALQLKEPPPLPPGHFVSQVQ